MKKANPTRVLLNDDQCRIFLKSMREFGYPKLTFEKVREIADQVAIGTYSETDVIAVIMVNQIDEAQKVRKK